MGNSDEEPRLDGICELSTPVDSSQIKVESSEKVRYIKYLRIFHTLSTRR